MRNSGPTTTWIFSGVCRVFQPGENERSPPKRLENQKLYPGVSFLSCYRTTILGRQGRTVLLSIIQDVATLRTGSSPYAFSCAASVFGKRYPRPGPRYQPLPWPFAGERRLL